MNEHEQHIEQLREERSCYICGVRWMNEARVAALDAAIAALEREQLQSSRHRDFMALPVEERRKHGPKAWYEYAPDLDPGDPGKTH